MAIRGVDVWEGKGQGIDWQLAAGMYRFAYLRCGNGNEGRDRFFEHNLVGVRSTSIAAGSYSVAFPLPDDGRHAGRDPVEQARAHFAASGGLGSRPGELPPALDLEWPEPGTPEWAEHGCSEQQVRDWAVAWLEETERLCGRAPVLYDGFPNYWIAIGGSADRRFARFPLWRADYRARPVTPGPWSDFALWQVTGAGARVPGALGGCGEDLFNGGEDEFRAFLGLPPAAG